MDSGRLRYFLLSADAGLRFAASLTGAPGYYGAPIFIRHPRGYYRRGFRGVRLNMNTATEKHYRVNELAELWGFSRHTIIRIFANEPGVLNLGKLGTERRRYVSLSIPESVALRVHERLGNQPFKPAFAGGNPLRVIRFGNLNRRVPKQPRNVLKLHPREQPANGESIP